MEDKDKNKFYDEVCNKHFSNQSALNKHLKTESHLKKVEFNELKEKNKELTEEEFKKGGKKEVKKDIKGELKKRFYCPLCDFKTKNREDLKTHFGTIRHIDNLQAYKEDVDKETFNKFENNLKEGQIFIGLFKGKEYKKDEIIKEYKINVKYVSDDRAKYGSKVSEEKNKLIKRIEKLKESIDYKTSKLKLFKKAMEEYEEKAKTENRVINPKLLNSYSGFFKNFNEEKFKEDKELLKKLQGDLKKFDESPKKEDEKKKKADEEAKKKADEEAKKKAEEEAKKKAEEEAKKKAEEAEEEDEDKEEDINDLIDYIRAEIRKINKFNNIGVKNIINYSLSNMYLFEEENDFINTYKKLDKTDKEKVYNKLEALYEGYRENFNIFLFRSLSNIKEREAKTKLEVEQKDNEIELFEKYEKLIDKLDITNEKKIFEYVDLIKQFNKERKKLKI